VRATGASGDAIFSAQTARCLTALGPVANASLPVTSAPCNQTRPQTFDLRFTPNGHAHYVQAASNRCLTKTATGLAATTDCSEVATKNWWIAWH